MLGPLLFLIYINGIASITLSDGTLVLFAVDVVIYRPIHTAADLSILERDLAIVDSWIASNHLTLNESRCKYMILSRKKSPVEHHPMAVPLILSCTCTLEYC